ncbi:hypothetical protein DEO72_LG6g541 [Vigna unguiculata]|uniref:Disease resistance protein At4g27190-like leucine-rich repeats domain-containing protein n=1 Tax=Vigna unguiculata TaxID=3917 RepID=A0A4D6M7B9_VIGUN|nr:hypothetical protein DEO72_LG6g541 [Vigna unguiculata]
MLTLSKLPTLKNVWNEDLLGILGMNHLREVHVEKCKVLTSVFSASVAKDIVELEKLAVKDSEGLITIVAEDKTNPKEQMLRLPFLIPV